MPPHTRDGSRFGLSNYSLWKLPLTLLWCIWNKRIARHLFPLYKLKSDSLGTQEVLQILSYIKTHTRLSNFPRKKININKRAT